MEYKDVRGITLVEVLAAVVIISIMSIFLFNIIQSSVEQNTKQTEETNNLFDITYAFKIVTKDIRRSNKASATGTSLVLESPGGNKTIYLLENSQLKKVVGGKVEVLTDGVGCARFVGNDVISITLSNTGDCSEGQNTKIHLRKGDV